MSKKQKLKDDNANMRQYVRLPRNYSVEVMELKFPIAKEYEIVSNSSDIGVGGISMESPSAFELGTKMQVRINIPHLNKYSPTFFKFYENDAEQYLVAIADVVWCSKSTLGYKLGLEFISLDSNQEKALRALIAKITSAPKIPDK